MLATSSGSISRPKGRSDSVSCQRDSSPQRAWARCRASVSTRSVRVREGLTPKTRTPLRGDSPPNARVKAMSEALAAAPQM
ncbi:hypothetical protein D3C87_651940 [compost metagenome]